MSLIDAFQDDFTTRTVDRARWAQVTGASQDPGTGLTLPVTQAGSFVVSHPAGDLVETAAYLLVSSVVRAGTGTCGWHLEAADGSAVGLDIDGSDLVAYYRTAAGVETHPGRIGYDPATMSYWRIGHTDGTLTFDASPDLALWTTVATTAAGGLTDLTVRLDTLAWGTATAGEFTVRRLNTSDVLDRGPGYLTETFESDPATVLPLNESFGMLTTLADGGVPASVSVTTDDSGRALTLAPDPGSTVVVATDLALTYADVEFTVDLTPTEVSPSTSVALAWRVSGGYATRYQVAIGSDQIVLSRVVAGTDTVLRVAQIGSLPGRTYHWQVTHLGTRIRVRRDAVEVMVLDDGALTDPGQAALLASSGARVDNLSLNQASSIGDPIPVTAMKNRYWGVSVTTGDPAVSLIQDPQVLAALESSTSAVFDIVSWTLGPDAVFPADNAAYFASQGRSNMISWSPADPAAVPTGALDTQLTGYATAIKDLASQTYLRLMPQMNTATTSPEVFLAAWRYIVDLFAAADCHPNWVFSVAEVDQPSANVLEDYWPGAEYVDVLGLEAYNWGTGDGRTWREYDEVFRDPYARLCGLDPVMPVWVTATGSKEPTEDDGAPVDAAHDKGAWVTALMEATDFPRIGALVWTSTQAERDWRVDSSQASLDAFTAALSLPVDTVVPLSSRAHLYLPIMAANGPVLSYATVTFLDPETRAATEVEIYRSRLPGTAAEPVGPITFLPGVVDIWCDEPQRFDLVITGPDGFTMELFGGDVMPNPVDVAQTLGGTVRVDNLPTLDQALVTTTSGQVWAPLKMVADHQHPGTQTGSVRLDLGVGGADATPNQTWVGSGAGAAAPDGTGASSLGADAEPMGRSAVTLGQAATVTGANAVAVGQQASAAADSVGLGADAGQALTDSVNLAFDTDGVLRRWVAPGSLSLHLIQEGDTGTQVGESLDLPVLDPAPVNPLWVAADLVLPGDAVLDGPVVHLGDGADDLVGFHGVAGITQPSVAETSTNEALTSLLTALRAYGLLG